MVIEVRLEQPSNALPPILVTELGISTEIKLGHSAKTALPRNFTELGRITDVSCEK